MHTFQSLRLQVLRFFDLSAEPDDAADVVMVENSLNSANQRRTVEENWTFMLSPVYTLSVIAGTQEYILPHYNFNRFHYLFSTTNKRFANQTPYRSVPYSGVSFNQQIDTDNLYFEIIPNASTVAAQPTSASTLTLTSSTAEPTSPTLYIEGEDSNGNFITDTIAKDGTTTNSYAKVTYYAKTADFAGTITLSAGATTLVSLMATEYGKQYSILRWHVIPVGNETFQYQFFMSPRVMSRNFDRPNIPFPYSEILVWDALLDLATYNELDSESVNIWRGKQQECLNNLYMYKLDGNSIAGFGSYINESSELTS